jgi:hypothetical protein
MNTTRHDRLTQRWQAVLLQVDSRSPARGMAFDAETRAADGGSFVAANLWFSDVQGTAFGIDIFPRGWVMCH